VERAKEMLKAVEEGDRPIGHHPENSLPIYVKTGRFGPYVQLGDPDPEDKKKKPKMVSLLPTMSPETVTIEDALKLLELPRTLGQDDKGVDIVAHLGRYGPYIKRGDDTRSLAPEDNLLAIDRDRALVLLAQEKRRGRKTATPLKVFEDVKELDGGQIKLLDGRYGPYVSDGETNASLPKTMEDPTSITLSHALELLEARRNAKPRRKKKTARKKVAKKKKKAAAKKKTTTKKTTKKKTTKKKKNG
jgi:DNA topoisomerase-1